MPAIKEKIPQTGCLKLQKCVFSVLEVRSPILRCHMIKFLGRTLFLAWRQQLYPHMPSSVQMCREGELSGVSFSSYEDTSFIGLGPHLYNSFNLMTSLKALAPNTITLEVRTSPYQFLGDTTKSITVRKQTKNQINNLCKLKPK